MGFVAGARCEGCVLSSQRCSKKVAVVDVNPSVSGSAPLVLDPCSPAWKGHSSPATTKSLASTLSAAQALFSSSAVSFLRQLLERQLRSFLASSAPPTAAPRGARHQRA